ncbi:MAG: cysteine desulfurase-like protein [Pyrinomonadaceae bacterium]
MPRDNQQPDTNFVASVAEIRAQFPALERVHNGNNVAYFDGPGGTQVPTSVVDAMTDYLFNHNANTHWEYPSSNETDQIIENSRRTFGDFLNAEPDEIVFGQNMTTLTFHLSRALGRNFQSGDEIVVTELDHHANSDTWRALAQDVGAKIRVLPMDVKTGRLELDKLGDLLNKRTKLVAIGAASNILGTINEFETVCAMARDAGALSFVDAVHYAAHELIDVKKIGCDFLAVSAYKFYGPHIGILFGRKELLEAIDAPRIRPAPDYSPDRMETGTQNHEGIAGAAAAVNFLAGLAKNGPRRERLSLVFEELHRRQHEMLKVMWEGLTSVPGVTIYGPPAESSRTPTISFSVAGHASEEVAKKLAVQGLFLSDGDFYASTVAEMIGAGGLIRAGLACYTSGEEVQRLIAEVRAIA